MQRCERLFNTATRFGRPLRISDSDGSSEGILRKTRGLNSFWAAIEDDSDSDGSRDEVKQAIEQQETENGTELLREAEGGKRAAFFMPEVKKLVPKLPKLVGKLGGHGGGDEQIGDEQIEGGKRAAFFMPDVKKLVPKLPKLVGKLGGHGGGDEQIGDEQIEGGKRAAFFMPD